MSEISGADVKDTKSEALDNYKSIKPEQELTLKELNNEVKDEFNKASEESDFKNSNDIKEYYDDNGNKYREGDKILPNIECEIGGYKYRTDDLGRTISAEGDIQVKDHEGYLKINESRDVVGNGELKDTDDRGHLIANRFNGKGDLINLVPMDSNLNRHGDYKMMENTLAQAKEAGADVSVKIEPIYEGSSFRPTEFRVTSYIDGDKEVRVFKNINNSEVKQ